MVPKLNSRLLISGFVIIKRYKYTLNFWRLKIKRFSYITRECVCSVSSVYKCFVKRSFRAIRLKFLHRHSWIRHFSAQNTALGTGHLSFFVAQNIIYNRSCRIARIEKHHPGKCKRVRKESDSMRNLRQACQSHCQSYNSPCWQLQVFLVLRPRLHHAGEIWKRRVHQMFSVYTTPEEFKIQRTFVGHFRFLCLRKTGAGNSHSCRDVTVHQKLRFQIVFSLSEMQISPVWKAFSKSFFLVTE